MNFDPFLIWLESTSLSVWMRESPSLLSLPGILTLHTLAMGFLAGTSLVVGLRLLGFARGIPVRSLERLFPILWLSFWINATTGVLLLLGYPTKAVTNVLFSVKLVVIAGALSLVPRIRRIIATGDGATLGQHARTTSLVALTSLLLWATAITVGRLLPYTYHRLLALE